MRNLFSNRGFWAFLMIAIAILGGFSVYHGQFKFVIIYLLLELYALARFKGWIPNKSSS
ncbi:MAG: hypothetical protein JW841_16460 [Deltaproteobacteria bacterium]|nr:hypothetical protein [Deltaproteobacteria bacterium]